MPPNYSEETQAILDAIERAGGDEAVAQAVQGVASAVNLLGLNAYGDMAMGANHVISAAAGTFQTVAPASGDNFLTIPTGGRFLVWGTVRCRISGVAARFIRLRLREIVTGQIIAPEQLGFYNPSSTAGIVTSTIIGYLETSAENAVYLDAARNNTDATYTIESDSNGYTKLHYLQLSRKSEQAA